ncbi:hypothetical protein Tco_1058392 [Tanacetum coccineum]|uniref:AtC3H46-like PABC-like domain-containing protein n=1 Tax=Tanacetum coccineum TaxID=301880 RepID=A0ABQ5H836_9ASTR
MDSYEATTVMFTRIKNLDLEYASKIMVLLLIQDHGEKDIIPFSIPGLSSSWSDDGLKLLVFCKRGYLFGGLFGEKKEEVTYHSFVLFEDF